MFKFLTHKQLFAEPVKFASVVEEKNCVDVRTSKILSNLLTDIGTMKSSAKTGYVYVYFNFFAFIPGVQN